MRNNQYKLVSLFLAILFCGQSIFAQYEEGIALPPMSAAPALTGSTLAVNGTNTLAYTNGGEAITKITNIVTLKILEGEAIYFKTDFTATAILNVELTDFNNTVVNRTCTLDVAYNQTAQAKYKVRDYQTYTDYKQSKVTIQSVTINGATGWDPKDVLEVVNEMQVLRYFNLSTVTANLTPTWTGTQTQSDAFDVSWNFPSNAGANMTQLEWAFIEDDMLGYYYVNPNYTQQAFNILFQSNSSRIDMEYSPTGYLYNIPMLYPEGKLYYRMRAVQRKANGTLLCGPWSVDSFAFAGHEDQLNWQTTTSFAEEGKFKTVIQYFDGSLRGRQTVTKDNSTGNVIVSETIYDLQGRPNVQILPTPTISNTIQYFEDFNKFRNMTFNDDPAHYFDLTPEALKCQPAPALSDSFGNGRYYSAQNDWLGTESKSDFIPDAQGYAYTETRFYDDATQRVREQGGVGIDHQIGSGHETKYFYGKPAQPELDALFGTEAGDASHYSKNMVKDANGQVSVSYVDMHGRTIATALAGDPTPGMDSIINSTDYPLATGTIRSDLLTPLTNIVQGNSIISVSTILAPATTNYAFTYKLDPAILQLLNCDGETICFDCKYDLEISIRDEGCGSQAPIIRKYNNLQLVPPAEACSTSMGFIGEGITTPVTEINFSETLPLGSYIVRKTLTLNEDMFNARRDSAAKALLCRTEQQIFDSVFNVLSTESGCGITNFQQAACDSCMAYLGTFTTYKAAYLSSIAPATATDADIHSQYASDSIQCAIACNTGTNPQFATLAGLRNQMLADMTPCTGQYAGCGLIENTASLEARYNIFTESYTSGGSTITTNKPYFRNPHHENGQLKYFDDEGTEVVFSPSLSTIEEDDFATNFENSWAASLIYYHPEYSKLQYAETTLKTSYEWLDRFLNCTTYQAAVTNGFTVPVGVSGTPVNDPFFTVSTGADKTAIIGKLYTGLTTLRQSPSIWQVVNGDFLCKGITDEDDRLTCMMDTEPEGLDPLITSDADKNAAWEKFKSIYISYRNEMVNAYINSHAPGAISQTIADGLVAEGKQLIFATNQQVADQNGWSWWSTATNENDTTGLGDSVHTYLQANVIGTCEGQRPLWRARLLQCEQLQALLSNETLADSTTVDDIIDTILDSMVMICNQSKNELQPYGASNTNPAWYGHPTNFEDVINNVFDDHGIHTLPGNNYFCNPYTIDFPKPYGSNPVIATGYSNYLDTCACNRFAALKAEAAALDYNTSSFTSMNEFFNAVYNDSLTIIVWNGLQDCDSILVDTCNYVFLRPAAKPRPAVYQRILSGDSCVLCVLNVNDRSANGQPDEYVATCQVNLLPGFETVNDDDVVIYIDSTLEECDSANCITPVITYVTQADTSNSIRVYYELPAGCDSCNLYMYNQSGTQLAIKTGICDSTNSWFTNIPDSCAGYSFVIKCFSDSCNTVSDTAYFNTYCPPVLTDTCIAPVITSAVLSSNANAVHVYYQLQPGCDSCNLYMYDINNIEIAVKTGICSTSDAWFTNLPDSCAPYKFIIRCFADSCNTTSAAFYSAPCVQEDTCKVYTPIALSEFAPIPAFLNCGYSKPCITCDRLNYLTTEFKTIYPSYSGVPYMNTATTDAQVNQNALWARFLNYRTGFSKNALDYMTAYMNCRSAEPPAYAMCVMDPPINSIRDIYPPTPDSCKNVRTQAEFITQLIYQQMKDSLIANFDSLYKAKCLNTQYTEQFYVEYQPKEYHYTLYYYDQAGNLVKTMPPAAVKPNYGSTYLASVAAARTANTEQTNPLNNLHLATQYRYNSLNQVTTQKTPDAGVSNFYYDRLGRLVVSQNAKQAANGNQYSYTTYDELGRITEVGQLSQTNPGDVITQAISQDRDNLEEWFATAASKKQVTRTVYDVSYYAGETPSILDPVLDQQNLRNRVSYTQVVDDAPSDGNYAGVHASATYYSYDVHGNVDVLVQDLKDVMNTGNRYKKITYGYDLISGKVNKVHYQPGLSDQVIHKYKYDAENRITAVKTSHDGIYWEQEAEYEYYRHGPLSRTVLGQNKVQGIDYAYTIQGWLKGVNSGTVGDGTTDMGADGKLPVSLVGESVARDVFGYSLHYYSTTNGGDYLPIGGSGAMRFSNVGDNLPVIGGGDNVETGRSLFNGNIKAMQVHIPALASGDSAPPLLYGYRYDQLNRITAMNAYTQSGTVFNVTTDYRERVSYDPNGNILTYYRNGAASQPGGTDMDKLTYGYNKDGSGNLLNNKLRHVKDQMSSSNYAEDIDDQADDNYEYDAIGNLVVDGAEGIKNPASVHEEMIEWTVYGKISRIRKQTPNPGTDFTEIVYTYDAAGNRISKIVTPPSGPAKKTVYVRDATGNVMGIYTEDAAVNSGHLTQSEVSLYGSSRLAVWNIGRDVDVLTTIDYSDYRGSFTRGNKFFELANHLGNVLVTITDKKVGVDSDDDGDIDYNTAEVSTANDYYPFGMQMPGRKFDAGNGYRYGFNKQEKDKEINENIFTALYWEYDSRIGRRWNVDPVVNFNVGRYTCFQNNPIYFTDFLGDKVKGKNKESAERTRDQMRNSFETDKVRNLFQLAKDGLTMKSISKTDFVDAIAGLSDDAKNLAYGFYNAINSTDGTITVEMVYQSQSLSSPMKTNDKNGKEITLKTGADVFKNGGSLTFSTGGKNSTAIVVMDLKDAEAGDDNDLKNPVKMSTSEVTVHEAFGHALNTLFTSGNSQNNNDALRMQNLYRRAKGISNWRNGKNHGNGTVLLVSEATSVPSYSQLPATMKAEVEKIEQKNREKAAAERMQKYNDNFMEKYWNRFNKSGDIQNYKN